MGNKIIHKHSTVITDGKAKLPNKEQLEYGELAINYADGVETMSIKNNADKIIEFKSAQYFEKIIEDNELITAGALNTINDKIDNIINASKPIEWTNESNLNDFKTPGVYNIYGERTNSMDNMPITNASPGHSISAKLTVIASTLQPNNTEICVTQFLQLSNRLGREGASYIRTYNENNKTTDGWSSWQKQQGIIETQFNSNEFTGSIISQTPILNFYLKMSGKTINEGGGLNSMIDNGMYSGLYTNAIEPIYDSSTGFAGYGLNMRTLSQGASSNLETFVLIVLNDYSATKLLGVDRHISQLKYAVNTGTGECTIKKRVGTGNDIITWSEWEEVGSQNQINEINDKIDNIINASKPIEWTNESNLNDFKTPGVYNIYGERTNSMDNMPITNASPGHSISAKLTVIASTLQPNNTEICVTQFLQLSNRLGREGASYIRTYNENNKTTDGWSAWQKQQGIIETQLNNDVFTGVVIEQPPILNHYYKMSGKTISEGGGLNSMIDNGMYSGLYTNAIEPIYDSYTGFVGHGLNMRTLSMGASSNLETFVLIVLNDYSAAKLLGADRHISQLKYAIHAGTGECTIKKRVGTGSDIITWSEWEEVGSQNQINELRNYIDTQINSLASALNFKGTIGTGGDKASLPDSHKVGDVYVVKTVGNYAGQDCEVGDIIICVKEGTSNNNSHWTIINTNWNGVDGDSELQWGETVTLATIGGIDINAKLPENNFITTEQYESDEVVLSKIITNLDGRLKQVEEVDYITKEQYEEDELVITTSLTETASAVKSAYDLANGKYTKPSTGIPFSDFEEQVQGSIIKAEESVQGVSMGVTTGNATAGQFFNVNKDANGNVSIQMIQNTLASGKIAIPYTTDVKQYIDNAVANAGGGGGTGGGGIPIQRVDPYPWEPKSIMLEPNTFYYWGFAQTQNISISFNRTQYPSNIEEFVFLIQFNNYSVPSVTLDLVHWVNGKTPEFLPGKAYEIHVLNCYNEKYATFAEYNTTFGDGGSGGGV